MEIFNLSDSLRDFIAGVRGMSSVPTYAHTVTLVAPALSRPSMAIGISNCLTVVNWCIHCRRDDEHDQRPGFWACSQGRSLGPSPSH